LDRFQFRRYLAGLLSRDALIFLTDSRDADSERIRSYSIRVISFFLSFRLVGDGEELIEGLVDVHVSWELVDFISAREHLE